MRKVLAIGWANTKRFLRQRSNLFFTFVFPILLILLLGMMYGGGLGCRIGVHVAGDGGPLTGDLVEALDDLEDVDVVTYDSEAALTDAVQRGRVVAGVLVPADYDAALPGGGSGGVG